MPIEHTFDYDDGPARTPHAGARDEDTPDVVVPLQHTHFDEVGTDVVSNPGMIGLEPGQVAGLTGIPGSGLTRLGLSLLLPHTSEGGLAYLDVRGWLNPAALWEMGVSPDRLIVVRCADVVVWSRVVAALLPGVRGVYAEVPSGVRDVALRQLAAKARTHRTPLVLRPLAGSIPNGVAQLRLEAHSTTWEGTDAGHGHLTRRRTLLEASGKAVRGREHTIEIEDHGTHDLRVVPPVGAHTTRRFAG